MPEHNNKSLDSDKRKELLSELTALKASLYGGGGIDMNAIPVLSDIIDIQDSPEDNTTSAPSPREKNGWQTDGSTEFDRELFLQEVMDSLMPQIEAELRRRLLVLDEQILYRWYQQAQGLD